MRIPTLFLFLGTLAGVAFANTNYHRSVHAPASDGDAIAFGHTDKLTVEKADLSLTTDGTTLRGVLRFVVSTWIEDRNDRSIMIAIPAGAEVSQLFVRIGDERFQGIAARSSIARVTYKQIVEQYKDPALLEWVTSSPQRTWLRLRVFPVTPKTPATIDLGITLRRADTIAIDPGIHRIGAASITVDDREQRATALETRISVDVPATPSVTSEPEKRARFVSRAWSLVAGEDIIDDETSPELVGQRVLGRGDIVTYY